MALDELARGCTLRGRRAVTLTEEELPSFYRSADAYASRWRRRFARLQAAQLMLLVVAAVGGATSWHKGSIEISAWLSVAALTVALVLRVVQNQLNPEGRWYEGRAAAESTKTLAWRFAIGAEPFLSTLDPENAARLFVQRLHEIASVLHNIDEPASGQQITDQMWKIRGSSKAHRVDGLCQRPNPSSTNLVQR